MKRILILGCDGYIGEHLIEKLSKNSAQLYGFDLKCDKQTSKNLKGFCLGDITADSELEKCIIDVNPHIIIDLAANAEVATLVGGAFVQGGQAYVDVIKPVAEGGQGAGAAGSQRACTFSSPEHHGACGRGPCGEPAIQDH